MKAEEQLYAICPKVGASLSFVGGLFIIHGFFTGARALRKKVFHRVACCMALCMTILSVSFFLGEYFRQPIIICGKRSLSFAIVCH